MSLVEKRISQYMVLVVVLFAYCHIVTIQWIIVRQASEFRQDQQDLPENIPAHWLNHFKYYMHYFYFVMTTISTNGYGDTSPNKDRNSEMFLSILTIITGLVCMTMFISISNVMLKSFHEQKAVSRKKIKDYDHWLRVIERSSKVNLDEDFVNKMSTFFRFTYTSDFNTVLYDDAFFELLPLHLQQTLEYDMA